MISLIFVRYVRNLAIQGNMIASTYTSKSSPLPNGPLGILQSPRGVVTNLPASTSRTTEPPVPVPQNDEPDYESLPDEVEHVQVYTNYS